MHESLTIDVIMEACERAQATLDNPGFCVACGTEHDDCEPDARNYKCDKCGLNQVFGAEELLMMVA